MKAERKMQKKISNICILDFDYLELSYSHFISI